MPAVEYLRAMKTEAQSDDSRAFILFGVPQGASVGALGLQWDHQPQGGCAMNVSLTVTEEITYRLSSSFYTACAC